MATGISQEIKGKIINAITQESVENANIVNKASRIVAVSDVNGSFNVEVSEFPVNLEITAMGFQTLTQEIHTSEEIIEIYLQPFAENLSEVVIQSTAIPNRLQEVAAPVGLISKSDLQRGDNTNLATEFNMMPGMYVNQGALNTNKINIRGVGARAQYSTNRIQSYFDGIPLTTAEGALTLDDIDAETLNRVEVIKGPTSSIYGAGLGGSINLYSKFPEIEQTRVSAKSQFGSFNTQKHFMSTSHATENSTVNASFTSLTSDGYRDNGNYDRKSGLVNARLKTSENNSLSFLANFTRLKAYIPSSINEEDFLNNPEVAAGNWENSQGYESYDRGLMGVSYKHYFAENLRNTTSVYMSFRDAYEPRPFDILKEERVSVGARTKFNWDTWLFDKESSFSFGAEYYNEWYETGTFENLYEDFDNRGSILGSRLSNNEQDRNYANFFGQINMALSEKWNLEAGFNLNNTKYSLTDLFTDDEVDRSGDYQFESVFSPRLATTYELSPGKNIYVSISHGFSTPTVAETLTPEGQINTDLKPEIGINYEVGFKGNWLENRLYTEISAYSIQIENLLVAQRVAEDQYVGMNAGKTDHNGLEFLARYSTEILPGLLARPYTNLTLNYFSFDEFINEEEDFSGNDLPGVPKSTFNLGLDLNTDWGLKFYSNFQAVGEIALDDSNSGYTDNYQLLNLKAAYEIELFTGFNLELYTGINNVLDEHYAASVLTNAVGFGGAAPRHYYPGNPRNYFGGLQLSYGF